MKITISGTPGAGKSTVGKLLAKKLEFAHFSIGDIMRDMAYEKHIHLLELQVEAEKDRGIDEELDQRQIMMGMNENNFVIDSKLGFHFIPGSIKVFLDADFEERAKRILSDKIRKEHGVNLENTKESITIREESEKKRYKEYYDLDPWEKSHYDIKIDTTNIKPDKIVDKIIRFIEKKKD